jgi:hypothetical protein
MPFTVKIKVGEIATPYHTLSMRLRTVPFFKSLI